jgi:hypothetical protein
VCMTYQSATCCALAVGAIGEDTLPAPPIR